MESFPHTETADKIDWRTERVENEQGSKRARERARERERERERERGGMKQ